MTRKPTACRGYWDNEGLIARAFNKRSQMSCETTFLMLISVFKITFLDFYRDTSTKTLLTTYN